MCRRAQANRRNVRRGSGNLARMAQYEPGRREGYAVNRAGTAVHVASHVGQR